eukprot:5692543-Pleurochrysis_carterae.AAC.1
MRLRGRTNSQSCARLDRATSWSYAIRRCARAVATQREALIVETSHDLRVGKWELTYPGLAQQLSLAGFNSRGPNFWSKVYDFSPNEDGPSNWSLLQGAALDKGVELRLAPQGLCGGRVEEVDCMPPKGLWAEGAAATDAAGAQNDGHGDSANDSAEAKAPGSATPRKPEVSRNSVETRCVALRQQAAGHDWPRRRGHKGPLYTPLCPRSEQCNLAPIRSRGFKPSNLRASLQVRCSVHESALADLRPSRARGRSE